MARSATQKKRPAGAKGPRIRPLQDRVLARRIEVEEQVRGGIIIPDTAKEKPQEAEVLAVGPGKRRDDGTLQPLDVAAGDRILIGKYAGTDLELEEEKLVILREDEIWGLLGA